MSTALVGTAIGGVFLSFIPDPSSMRLLYGFWGLTTILLFWAAMMKATRIWGGEKRQGRAFGFLDGGRGAVGALVGSIAVGVFSVVMPDGDNAVTASHRIEAFQLVMLFASGWVMVVAVLVLFGLPSTNDEEKGTRPDINLDALKKVIKYPAVWFQALLILCAYSGYKTTDDFSLYANEVLGFDEVRSAAVGSALLWLRPVAAILAGILADKVSASRMITLCFALMLGGGLMIGTDAFGTGLPALMLISLGSTAMAVYALRGLYFAIMGEANIPIAVTGTAVGVASIVGYLPDIYMGPLMGYLLDSSPGEAGHRHLFLVMTGFATIGLVVSMVFRRHLR